MSRKIIGVTVGTPMNPEKFADVAESAYDIAVKNGFDGTEAEWLASLNGNDGKDGVDGKDGYTPIKGVDYFDGRDGTNGKDGVDGKSAYAYAKDGGYMGTEEEYAKDTNPDNIKYSVTPVKGVDYYTEREKAEFSEYIASELAKRGQLKPEFAQTIDECTDTSKLYVLPDGMIWTYQYFEGGTQIIEKPVAVTWNDGYRFSASSGSLSALADRTCAKLDLSSFVTGDEIVFSGLTFDNNTYNNCTFVVWKDNAFKSAGYLTKNYAIDYSQEGYGFSFNVSADGTTLTVTIIDETTSEGITLGVTGYPNSSNASVVYTVEETLSDGYAWADTGLAFVPADYEERIIDLEEEAKAHDLRMATLENKTSGIINIASYVLEEAETVADKILSVRSADTFVMACVSDLHTSGDDTSAVGVLHAGQAMNIIQSMTELDLVAILGDVQVGDFETTTTGSFKYVKKCFADVAKGVPYMHLQGNHDELPSDTTEVAQQRYYAFIGANNVGTVTDYANKFRNYGYRDFENYKVRVIYLNTADVSENEMTYDNCLTAAQMAWFVNTALKLSDKSDASEWGVIVCGHHPLNWVATGNGSVAKVLDVLDAYKGRASGSVTVDGQSIAYNFTDETSEFVCHVHGHTHNFREEVLGTNGILTITVPNACYDRNNEYGTAYTDYPDVVQRYGDDGADNDGTGTQRVYVKTANTAEDTAFSVFCIDRASKTINVFNYGAGIDRKWSYSNLTKLNVSDREV
jgi:hypothetical protein